MKNKLGLILFPAFDWEISKTHPERKERLLYTKDQIIEEGLEDILNISFYNPVLATNDDIKRVHYVVPNVESILTNSHYISSGGAIKALNLVENKTTDKAFALVRPPGHHAMKVVYGDRGFCIVNNVAVMIEKYRQKNKDAKVAIIDTDAHHGDGTENIYYNDPNVLFISIHQDGRTLYPGTGFTNELGGPNAYGYNINIPLPPNTTDEGYMYVYHNLIKPILKDFNPDIIINSAGQDNHYSDPLTNMNLSARGYAKLNELINPDVSVLEGGYSIEGALPYINTAIIFAMANIDYSNVIEPDFSNSKIKQNNKITNYIKNLVEEINNNYFNREKLIKSVYPDELYITESRKIYYDTSNILEHQKITYKRCDKCNGVEVIKSNSNKNDNILAIEIPLKSCEDCLKEGYKMYNDSNKNYTNVYLKDRYNDKYLNK